MQIKALLKAMGMVFTTFIIILLGVVVLTKYKVIGPIVVTVITVILLIFSAYKIFEE